MEKTQYPLENTGSLPTVIDAGKQKKKDIKKLEHGEGPLMKHVEAALARTGAGRNGKEVVPVVIVYEKKAKRKKRGLSLFGPLL
jgi:hypothetical protein